ncbi:hypothetical protein HYH03_009576 [Edaphochlamys debaryana]|uniref:Protein kinase domain-containing protein n=1 Tax=Edaphochlamys debaryana TaxID=47281 RepID=A0A835Y3Y3_9CHLO|nr:hypothetical protein HYH03_009576 [Edaphochlamys debaryana]|eukprot:KAG2492080.1 hypothetical protein HYH03_009576 [Edaphochlamys debaryana]
MSEKDWLGISSPVVLNRNLTVRGTDSLPGPPFLILKASLKVVLGDNVTLSFLNVVLYGFRADNILRAPGFDLLAPRPLVNGHPPSSWALLVVDSIFGLLDFCYPPSVASKNFAAVVRPASLPGVQQYDVNVSYPCLDRALSVADLSRRCWPMMIAIYDMALTGRDLDLAGTPRENHYDMWIGRTNAICRNVLSDECLEKHGPIGCLLLMQSSPQPPIWDEFSSTEPIAHRAFSPGPSPSGPTSSPPADDAPAAAAAAAASGGVPLAPVLGGCLGAGVLLVAAVAAAAGAALVLRRRRMRHLSLRQGGKDAAPDPESGTRRLHERSSQLPLIEEEGSLTNSCKGKAFDDQAWRTSGGSSCDAFGASTQSSIVPAYASHSSPPAFAAPESGERRDADVLNHLTPPRAIDDCTLEVVQACEDASAAGGAPSASGLPGVVTLLPRVLGKGSFGRVMEGRFNGERVAVKLLGQGGPGGFGLGGAAVSAETMNGLQAELVKELQVLARCQHPNIVRLLAASLEPPHPCMVLEAMDTSLDKVLYGSTTGPVLLPLDRVLYIATQVVLGLEYLHPAVLHRDVKPANVLLSNLDSDTPTVKLSDFGLARVPGTALLTLHPEAGTPAYVAPESFDLDNLSITHKVDIYAFGCLLWEMLSGIRPWHGMTPVQVARQVTLANERLPIPPPRDAPGRFAARWPPRLQRLIQDCWDRDPRRRPAAADVVRILVLIRQAHKHEEDGRPSPESAAVSASTLRPDRQPAQPPPTSPLQHQLESGTSDGGASGSATTAAAGAQDGPGASGGVGGAQMSGGAPSTSVPPPPMRADGTARLTIVLEQGPAAEEQSTGTGGEDHADLMRFLYDQVYNQSPQGGGLPAIPVGHGTSVWPWEASGGGEAAASEPTPPAGGGEARRSLSQPGTRAAAGGPVTVP